MSASTGSTTPDAEQMPPTLAELLAADAAVRKLKCQAEYYGVKCGRDSWFAFAAWCDGCGVRAAHVCDRDCLYWVFQAELLGPDVRLLRCGRHGLALTIVSSPELIRRTDR